MSMAITVALTGASGSLYALRLIEYLKRAGCTVYLICSEGGVKTLKHETDPAYRRRVFASVDEIFENSDTGSSLASGSYLYDALVIVPCSVNTIGLVHGGLSDTLIGRAAMVCQKERRKLILVPRETPMGTTSLKQLYELSLYGASILPASPGFYHHPRSVEDMVDFVVAKILNLLGLKASHTLKWTSNELC